MRLDFLKNKLESFIPEYIKILGQVYEFHIAGGAITSLITNNEINDLDIYIKNKKDFIPLIMNIGDLGTLLSVTDKSILYRIYYGKETRLINLILIDSYETPEKIFSHFDFTCVMGAYNVKTEEFTFHEDFFIDTSMRQLHYNPKTKFPLMSCLRVKKYENKGFKISKNEMTKILLSVCNLNINSYEDLANQINGLYGFNVDDLFDTSVEFDMMNIINKFSEISEDYDLIFSDKEYDKTSLEKRKETLLIKLLTDLKNDGITINHSNFIKNINNNCRLSINGELINIPPRFTELSNFISKSFEERTTLLYTFKTLQLKNNIYYSDYNNHIISQSGELIPDRSNDIVIYNGNQFATIAKLSSDETNTVLLRVEFNECDAHFEVYTNKFFLKRAKVIDIYHFKAKNKPKIKKKEITLGTTMAPPNSRLDSLIRQTTKLPFNYA